MTKCLRDVQPEPIAWLWPARIARGKVTLIAGDPGLGKSMLTCAMAAHVSRGTSWPVDRSPCPQGDVIMLSAEDDPGDTIRPRLDAAGADVNKIHAMTMVTELDRDGEPRERAFNLAKDIEGLNDLLIQRPECRLVIIDPVSAYLGGTDSHNNADIRALLAPLAMVASNHKVAVVAITHLNKSQQANALYRASGSLAFVAAARAAYSVTKDPDNPDRRLILPLKNNLGDDRTGFAYTIVEADNGAPVLVWEDEPVEMTLEDIANAVTNRRPRRCELAKDWLKEALKDGPRLSVEVEEEAEAAGFSEITIRRARKDLGIKPHKRFDKKWEWQLPETGEDHRYLRKTIKDDHSLPVNKVSTFKESDHLNHDDESKVINFAKDDHKTGRREVITFADVFAWLAPADCLGTTCPSQIGWEVDL